MRIIGIDPGYAIVGFGVVDYDGSRFTPVEYGAIFTEANTPFHLRLKSIYDDMEFILDKYKPERFAIEKLFFTTNQKTGIDVAQARGILLLSAVSRGLSVFEYTPLQVKQAVVGYGRAEKNQVMDMTKRILNLQQMPKPDDAADALAIAICDAHCSNSNRVNCGCR
ncbi:MAG: crossover junction endodeoxyribonuclease RuvC [Clostridiales bacterium]|nr:crossover junction endodeoxyribonuclease RuvC [Clostridiales bacterium]